MAPKNELLRSIPKVDEILAQPLLREEIVKAGHTAAAQATRQVLEKLRQDILAGVCGEVPSQQVLAAAIQKRIGLNNRPSLRRVINATGVILHTNLGRAPLAKSAGQAVWDVLLGYSNLEYNVETASRGSRYSHVAQLLCELTGAEDAVVVNNNASAVLLMLSALTAGKEVVVSRGELVEIGGAFRIPDIMSLSGAVLREVGTTNRTRPADYEAVINPEATGALFKAHTSNFKIIGFTQEVQLEEMVELGRRHSLPVLYDVGSGSLLPLETAGIQNEPSVPQCLAAGADVVSFSGDKLLGGPQAGIILGCKGMIERIKAHPLMRAVRIDKMTLAALEATLRLYRDTDEAIRDIPTLGMLFATPRQLQEKAEKLLNYLGFLENAATVVETTGQMGGGSLPGQELPSAAVQVDPLQLGMEVNHLEQALRGLEVPVIVRIHRDKILLDVRTLEEEDFAYIAAGLRQAAEGGARE